MGNIKEHVANIKLAVSSISHLTHLKYPSKKDIRKALNIIEKSVEQIPTEPIDSILKDTDDQEIKYFMIVKQKGDFAIDAWREEIKTHGVPSQIEEQYAIEQAQETIENFNGGLRPIEKERELMGVVMVIKHERQLWTPAKK
jgi:hypothetical protein